MSDEIRFMQWIAKKYEMTYLDFEKSPQETRTILREEYEKEMNDTARERIKAANALRKNETDTDWLFEHQGRQHYEERKKKKMPKWTRTLQDNQHVEKYYYVTKGKKENKSVILIIKIIAIIASIFIGGWLQSMTLQPSVHNVYLGLSLVTWAAWSYFSYHALCRLMLWHAGIYKF